MLASSAWRATIFRQATRSISTGRSPGPRNTLRKPGPSRPLPRPNHRARVNQELDASQTAITSKALKQATTQDESHLLSLVHIPEDPHGILKGNHPVTSILANSSIVVQREIELMNVLLSFEQANKYIIMDAQGNHVGFLAEQEHGVGNMLARQMFRTHRSFTTHVFDKNEIEVLRFHRPFSWINSRIRIYDTVNPNSGINPSSQTALQSTIPEARRIPTLGMSEMRIIGEAHQQWHPWRRKYDLFLNRPLEDKQAQEVRQPTSGELPISDTKAAQVSKDNRSEVGFAQFAHVNEPLLSWDFALLSSDDRLIGSVNRNFRSFAREIFTDTGAYALRMDAASLEAESQYLISKTGKRSADSTQSVPGMTLDQRAVMLATAVSIDFDYFSRHSHAGTGGWLPMWFPGYGGAAGEAGAAGAEAGTAVGTGAATESGTGVVGGAAKGIGGMGEGAIAGAGTAAAYEAMQRGAYGSRRSSQDDASHQTWDYPEGQQAQNTPEAPQGEDVWGENAQSPWADRGSGNSSGGRGDGDPGDSSLGGGGGNVSDAFSDWF
ncbi:Scramblase-domain-containing protein [Patellaria atrata CBS 101060]|uniref:Scramblase-domain-containing protein n=1 Tax=Patellaria atrata CBS 101060 TaxID=1346257 RepID=A0A9P4SGJ7_9PEZI|nr:Scramblase-domain-containing protein [Patellaria atrata CBS 101060]